MSFPVYPGTHRTPALRDSNADFPGIYCGGSAPFRVNLKLRSPISVAEGGRGGGEGGGRRPCGRKGEPGFGGRSRPSNADQRGRK